MGKYVVVPLLWVAASAGSALAQDFGPGWLDRVTFDMQRERGPLEGRELYVRTWGGMVFYRDNNVFLEETNKKNDTIIIPFARVRLNYAVENADVAADLTANYKIYDDIEDADGHEERLFFRARMTESDFSVEVAEVLRRESDPSDALFLDRVERFVSDTFARAALDVTPEWAVESTVNFQSVGFEDAPFEDTIDNNNVRVDGAVVGRTPAGIDVLAQVGYTGIFYRADQTAGAPPDASGYYARGGLRGESTPGLVFEAIAGISLIESDTILGTTRETDDSGLDASFRLAYEAMPELTVYGAYIQRFTFGGAGDPYQRINRAIARVVLEPVEMLTVTGRVQADFVESAFGVEREFFTAGGTATYEITPNLVVDGGVTARHGKVTGGVIRQTRFDNVIFYVGVALSY